MKEWARVNLQATGFDNMDRALLASVDHMSHHSLPRIRIDINIGAFGGTSFTDSDAFDYMACSHEDAFAYMNGESGRCRTPFRDRSEHDSGTTPNMIPG